MPPATYGGGALFCSPHLDWLRRATHYRATPATGRSVIYDRDSRNCFGLRVVARRRLAARVRARAVYGGGRGADDSLQLPPRPLGILVVCSRTRLVAGALPPSRRAWHWRWCWAQARHSAPFHDRRDFLGNLAPLVLWEAPSSGSCRRSCCARRSALPRHDAASSSRRCCLARSTCRIRFSRRSRRSRHCVVPLLLLLPEHHPAGAVARTRNARGTGTHSTM